LRIEYEAAVEDLLGQGALAAEYNDFIVSDLECKTHVTGDPGSLVTLRPGGLATNSYDLLPHVLGDVIALNSVHNGSLVNTSTKGKNVVVLE